jgi:hypothetical protein
MSESLLRNFTHITIPAEIWLRKDISIQAKALWAELRSLHDRDSGGCYASDEYLMEFMCLKKSRLHEIYKELKDVGLLEVVSFNGRRTVRRAIVPEVEYQTGKQLSGKPESRITENRKAEVQETGNLSIIYNKENNKEKTPPNPQGEKCVFGSHVKMKKEEYTELESKISKPVLDDLIEQINDYCASHGKSYKDYAATIRSWYKRKKDDPNVKSKSTGVNFRSELEKLGFQSGGIYNNILLEIDDKGICFYLGTAQSKIEFNEPSFMDKFRNFCEKQNIQFLKKQEAYGT